MLRFIGCAFSTLALTVGIHLALAVLAPASVYAICETLEGHSDNNSYHGLAFEVSVQNDVIIRHISVQTQSSSPATQPVEIWYNLTSATPGDPGWEYVGEGVVSRTGDRELVPVDIDLFVPGGTTMGLFYVGNSSDRIPYTSGGITDISDGNLTISGSYGYGGEYDTSFTPPIDPAYSPRVFAGSIH